MLKQKLEISQLHRLQGQLQGVEKMFKTETEPTLILQQLEAVRGSLKSLEKKILKGQTAGVKSKELRQTLNYLLKIN